MKRDMELIKAVLLFAEEHCVGKGGPAISAELLPTEFKNTDPMVIRLHARLLKERGLIQGSEDRSNFYVESLTWDGHEFLDNARDPKVWNATKQAAGHLSWNVFTNVLTSTAINYAHSLLGGS